MYQLIFSSLHQIFEANCNKPDIVLTIVESGHLLVWQGEESLVRRNVTRLTVFVFCCFVFHSLSLMSYTQHLKMKPYFPDPGILYVEIQSPGCACSH